MNLEALERIDTEERHGLLISIQPKYAAAILSGTKTVELRRRAPRGVDGATAVMYASGAVRAVVGTVEVRGVENGTPEAIWERFSEQTCISRQEFDKYFAGSEEAFALILSGAIAAPHPIALPDLRSHDLEPPQSWRYLTRAIIRTLRSALGLHDGYLSPSFAGNPDSNN